MKIGPAQKLRKKTDTKENRQKVGRGVEGGELAQLKSARSQGEEKSKNRNPPASGSEKEREIANNHEVSEGRAVPGGK